MDKNKVLAEGEATGHAHRVLRGQVMTDGDRVTLESPEGDLVTHEEHHTIEINPGTYDRLIVNEYDHAAEEARAVVD